MSGNSKYILEIQTGQAPTFKQVIDALKEILIDVNFEFDETGLRVVAIDNTQAVLVYLKLEADSFEKYFCEKKLYVGINMLKLHMLIKTISNNDVLTLFIERDDPNALGIRIENSDKSVKTTYKLNMLDIDVMPVKVPDTDFDCTVTMPSTDFQKIVRDMHHLAEYIEIQNVENQLCFRCKGEFCTQETVLSIEKNPNLTIIKNEEKSHEIIQGVYNLKYLVMFTKCTNLCGMVEINLKNNFPIIMSYSVASLGTIKLCCSEKEDD